MTTITRRVMRRRKPSVPCFLVLHLAVLAYFLFTITKKSSPSSGMFSISCSKDAIIYQPPAVLGVAGQPCSYEGHCGVGTTCVPVAEDTTPGKCVSYTPTSTKKKMFKTEECAKFCTTALGPHIAVDSVQPLLHESSLPNGCVVLYRQETQTNLEHFDRAAFVNVTRQNRIVRIDPLIVSGKGVQKHLNTMWMALCYEPCGTCGKGFVCQEGVCQRDEAYWNPSQENKMVIVTGADDRYFSALMNLAGSIRHWASKYKIVVYNLGMNEEQITDVESWGNVLDIKWRSGIPKHYPDHLSLAKAYAWKPVAINESLHEYKQIFWVDAGSTIAAPIDPIVRVTQQSGILLVKGQDDSMRLSHQCTYGAFGYDKESFRGGPHYSGNTQAYLYPSKYVDTIVIPNAQCALQPECIKPLGSGLQNHRYDQTSLSILSYRDDMRIPHHTQYLAAGREQLEGNLKATPSKHIVWTSRGSCTDFYDEMFETWAKYKDQFELTDVFDDGIDPYNDSPPEKSD